jgi:hypothetical protein
MPIVVHKTRLPMQVAYRDCTDRPLRYARQLVMPIVLTLAAYPIVVPVEAMAVGQSQCFQYRIILALTLVCLRAC